MYNPDTELLFPPRLLPQVRDLRGPVWKELVDRVNAQPPASLPRLGFELLMARLHGCAACQADSFRAMQGCTQCALQTIKRHRASDEDLAEQFAEACRDVEAFLHNDR